MADLQKWPLLIVSFDSGPFTFRGLILHLNFINDIYVYADLPRGMFIYFVCGKSKVL